MKKRHLISIAFLLGFLPDAFVQTISVPSTLDRWDTLGKVSSETYLGKESILIESGMITAKNSDLKDGTIEADISFPQQRNFPGIVFRMQDRRNSEYFYVRPHQSGNPDATQYTPVFNGQAGWQLYYGEGYSKAFTFKFNQWHHVKIELHGLQAEIYIDDMQTPLIKVSELLTGWKGGKIGLVSEGGPLHVTNVQFTPKQGLPAPTVIPVAATGTGGLVTQWQVSNVVSPKLFEKKYELTPDIKNNLKWTTQRSEPSGTINLARFGQMTQTENAIVAKVVIQSSSDQMKELTFGFSDFVLVYLNDRALYFGMDNFMSRDYRFLGTVGFFDKLFLPLKKGDNELWFVVAENFGGWGVKAKFDNMDGITLK